MPIQITRGDRSHNEVNKLNSNASPYEEMDALLISFY